MELNLESRELEVEGADRILLGRHPFSSDHRAPRPDSISNF